jgi:hypothetical protein
VGSGLVEATFDTKSAKLKCTDSQAETGTVAGTLKVKAGEPIRVK